MSHRYDKDGQLHEVDLREARKQGYVPGVTDVIHEFTNSVGLDIYKAKQMFMASLTLPRPEGISDKEYFQLVQEDSKQHSEKAKEFGSILHYWISERLYNRYVKISNKLLRDKSLEVVKWIKQNKDSAIVDFKTQETKEGKFNQPYNEWLFQLCGYYNYIVQLKAGEYIEYSFYNYTYGGQVDYAILHGSLRDKIKLINIMISSTEDIPIKIYEWKQDKIEWGCQVFNAMLNLYRVLKKL